MGKSDYAEAKEIYILREKVAGMFELAQGMFQTAFDGLMEHDMDILNRAIKDDDRLTKMYNDLTALAIESSKKKLSAKAKKIVVDLVDVIGTIERIGDSIIDLSERIEYKIKENLMFSDEAVDEYRELHNKVKDILFDAVVLLKTEDKKFAKSILGSKQKINELFDNFSASHIDRSARGICDEWAKIRYLDMLEFTKEVAYHCMEIANRMK